MGTSVHTKRAKPRIGNTPRERLYTSPLDRAAGWEVNWQRVAPAFDVARRIENPVFVYFIGEDEDGPIKIGSAKDPILRLRALQTGNPRRLQVEYVLIGGAPLERLLHELWEPFAVRSKRGQKVDALPGTEWFTADARPQLEPILKTAGERQVELVAMTTTEILLPAELERVVREAHAEHGYTAEGRDEVRLLGAGSGYTIRRRSRI